MFFILFTIQYLLLKPSVARRSKSVLRVPGTGCAVIFRESHELVFPNTPNITPRLHLPCNTQILTTPNSFDFLILLGHNNTGYSFFLKSLQTMLSVTILKARISNSSIKISKMIKLIKLMSLVKDQAR